MRHKPGSFCWFECGSKDPAAAIRFYTALFGWSTSEAEMPEGAWVLGFESEGQAFAYDLNLLNSHEVVNHGTESVKFAAVW